VLVPLLVGVALSRITPRYTATGAVIYEPSAYALQELQSILRVDPTTDAIMASQAEIVRGLHTAERIADRLQLQDLPEFNPAMRPPSTLSRLSRWMHGAPPPTPTPEEPRAAIVQAVQQALSVQALRSSRVLAVVHRYRPGVGRRRRQPRDGALHR
jgi:uncharacterized protein involved in exopolysaccharide biosynthesis